MDFNTHKKKQKQYIQNNNMRASTIKSSNSLRAIKLLVVNRCDSIICTPHHPYMQCIQTTKNVYVFDKWLYGRKLLTHSQHSTHTLTTWQHSNANRFYFINNNNDAADIYSRPDTIHHSPHTPCLYITYIAHVHVNHLNKLKIS